MLPMIWSRNFLIITATLNSISNHQLVSFPKLTVFKTWNTFVIVCLVSMRNIWCCFFFLFSGLPSLISSAFSWHIQRWVHCFRGFAGIFYTPYYVLYITPISSFRFLLLSEYPVMCRGILMSAVWCSTFYLGVLYILTFASLLLCLLLKSYLFIAVAILLLFITCFCWSWRNNWSLDISTVFVFLGIFPMLYFNVI